MNTPPPASDGKDNSKKDISKEFIEVVNKNIDKVPKETNSNPWGVQNGKIVKAVQPHNYRLYFDFENPTLNPTQPYTLKNYNSEKHFIYPTHRIVVRKNSIEVTYLAHEKQWRRIIADSDKDIDIRLNEIEKDIEDKLFTYLKEFIARNGGKTNFKLLRKRKQDWGIHGDSFLDNIPNDLIISDTIFKKHYSDKVEFFGASETKNYISNRALERFSPEIANKLEIIERTVEGILKVNESTCDMINTLAVKSAPTLAEFHSDVKVHNRVLKGIEKAFNKFNSRISQKKLSEY